MGSGEGAEVDAVDALRERAAAIHAKVDAARERAAETLGEAREKAAEVTGQVRARAADAADAVRNRIAGMMEGDGQGGADVPAGERAAAMARQAGDTFEERFHERPLQTLLIAGIAGFVVGRLLR